MIVLRVFDILALRRVHRWRGLKETSDIRAADQRTIAIVRYVNNFWIKGRLDLPHSAAKFNLESD